MLLFTDLITTGHRKMALLNSMAHQNSHGSEGKLKIKIKQLQHYNKTFYIYLPINLSARAFPIFTNSC